MGSAKTAFIKKLAGLVMASGLAGGCASDHSPPQFHTDIQYDRSQSHTFLSAVSPGNAPSTRDWKTNNVAGVGYGTTGADTAAPNVAGGAASTPSGTSSGAGAGVSGGGVSSGGAGISTAPAIGPVPGSGTPGTIIGNPPGTGIIGTSPAPAPSISTPASTLNPPSGIRSPPTGTGLGSTPFRAPTTPGVSGIGVTNTGSSVLLTNTFTGQTNLLPGTGFRPSP